MLPRANEAPITSINALSGDLLLKIFYHSQPVHLDEDGADDDDTLEARKWDSERWWYKFAHVCRKWRDLMLSSAPHMGLSILCSYGTPVADILAHSPSLPLIIDYGDEHRDVTSEDELGILCALRNHLQVRRIRLRMPASSLQRLVAAIDGDFPMLEYLYIKPLTDDDDSGLSFPETFKAPQLRHFRLRNITYSAAPFRSLSANPPVQPATQIDKCERGNSPQPRKFLEACIHILDDDSLLCIFHLCRPVMLNKDEFDHDKILQARGWGQERWWYKLVQVCRRWRYLIFASTSHLGLHLHCTYGTPVTDMLAHSPPLPLVIDYPDEDRDTTAEDRDAVLFALQHRDRVRRIRVLMPISKLQKLTTAFDNEFPILEYMYFGELPTDYKSGLILPNGFRAPHLRHLILLAFPFPVRSPLLMTAVGLVTLSIQYIHPSTNCCPEDIFQQLILLPQLKTLGIGFSDVYTHRDVETQLSRRPLITNVTLPNLRWLGIRGISTYLEALLPRMTTPLLEKLQLVVLDPPQADVSIPRLLQFMCAEKNLKFYSARFRFASFCVLVFVRPCEGDPIYTFQVDLGILCMHLDEQVVIAAQIFHQLRTMFSAIEHLTLEFRRSSETDNQVQDIRWGDLFRQFSKVKTLRLDNELVRPVSRSLQVDGGGPTMELLPELKVLEYPACRNVENSFNGFIDARKNAGLPVTVVHV